MLSSPCTSVICTRSSQLVFFIFVSYLVIVTTTIQGEDLIVTSDELKNGGKLSSNHQQLFSNRDKEAARRLLDSGQLHDSENEVGDSNTSGGTTEDVLVFDPPFVDFGIQSIGKIIQKQVQITNVKDKLNVRLNSISGSTQHIHASFFQAKLLYGGENTTFQVVFLPRYTGNVESTLFINTSEGRFSYQLFGVGHPNPYKLKTLLSSNVYFNSSYSPLITIYNPTSKLLQVEEIYSSSLNLHLQLPNGQDTADRHLWEIPPYETKAVMRASFLADHRSQHGNNQTAYINIKTKLHDQFKIPMEIQISTKAGIYFSQEELDFGTIRSNDETRTMSIFLFNPGPRDVIIRHIETQRNNKAVTIEFQPPYKLAPSKGSFNRIANISFTADMMSSNDDSRGKLVLTVSNENQEKVFLPFKATVLEGTLGWNESSTTISLFESDDFIKRKQQSILSSASLQSSSQLSTGDDVSNSNDDDVTQKNDDVKVIKRDIELMNSFLLPIHIHRLEIRKEKNEEKQQLPLIEISSEYETTPKGEDRTTITTDIILEARRNITTCFTITCIITSQTSLLYNKLPPSITRYIYIHTNLSRFSIPIQLYTNQLQYEIETSETKETTTTTTTTKEDETEENSGTIQQQQLDENESILDFNVVAVAQHRSKTLTVFNHNPVPITIEMVNTTVPGIRVNLKQSHISDVDDVDDVISTTTSSSTSSKGERDDVITNQVVGTTQLSKVTIGPRSNISFDVIFSSPPKEESYTGMLIITTLFQEIEIKVRAQVEMGSLNFEPEKLEFPPSFPGKVVQQTLKITSSFAHSTKIESFTSANKLFYHRKLRNKESAVNPGKNVKTGKIYFDSRQECKVEGCYTSLPSSTTLGHSWLTSLSLGRSTFEIDQKCFTHLSNRWNHLKNLNMTRRNTTFELKTSSQQIYKLEATASLYWPLLADSDIYQFPLTMIGKTSHLDVKLHNPSDLIVLIQILPISYYPQSETLSRYLNLTTTTNNFIFNDTTTFRIQSSHLHQQQHTSEEHALWWKYALRLNTNHMCSSQTDKCSIILLNPKETKVLPISYVPKTHQFHQSVILIRNNLTVLETLHVKGNAYNEQIRIGNCISGNSNDNILMMQYTRELLSSCQKKGEKEPLVTLQKKFQVKNMGPLPLVIRHLLVDQSPCEGYGFKIINCKDFNTLQPNTTHDIIFRYSPDFTASWVERKLQIITKQGSKLEFVVNITIPRDMLDICQSVIPRPSWEYTLHSLFTIIASISLFLTVIFSVAEAKHDFGQDRIISGRLKEQKELLEEVLTRNLCVLPHTTPSTSIHNDVIITNYNKQTTSSSRLKIVTLMRMSDYVITLMTSLRRRLFVAADVTTTKTITSSRNMLRHQTERKSSEVDDVTNTAMMTSSCHNNNNADVIKSTTTSSSSSLRRRNTIIVTSSSSNTSSSSSKKGKSQQHHQPPQGGANRGSKLGGGHHRPKSTSSMITVITSSSAATTSSASSRESSVTSSSNTSSSNRRGSKHSMTSSAGNRKKSWSPSTVTSSNTTTSSSSITSSTSTTSLSSTHVTSTSSNFILHDIKKEPVTSSKSSMTKQVTSQQQQVKRKTNNKTPPPTTSSASTSSHTSQQRHQLVTKQHSAPTHHPHLITSSTNTTSNEQRKLKQQNSLTTITSNLQQQNNNKQIANSNNKKPDEVLQTPTSNKQVWNNPPGWKNSSTKISAHQPLPVKKSGSSSGASGDFELGEKLPPTAPSNNNNKSFSEMLKSGQQGFGDEHKNVITTTSSPQQQQRDHKNPWKVVKPPQPSQHQPVVMSSPPQHLQQHDNLLKMVDKSREEFQHFSVFSDNHNLMTNEQREQLMMASQSNTTDLSSHLQWGYFNTNNFQQELDENNLMTSSPTTSQHHPLFSSPSSSTSSSTPLNHLGPIGPPASSSGHHHNTSSTSSMTSSSNDQVMLSAADYNNMLMTSPHIQQQAYNLFNNPNNNHMMNFPTATTSPSSTTSSPLRHHHLSPPPGIPVNRNMMMENSLMMNQHHNIAAAGGYWNHHDVTNTSSPHHDTSPWLFTCNQFDDMMTSSTSSSHTNVTSSHSIWSVSNAVTMDEDKQQVVKDPYNLRRLWTKP